MAGRYVRSSSYRHVFGSAAKLDQQFTSIRPECKGESGYIACSPDFFAFPIVGGGGPVVVKKYDETGRLGAGAKKLAVHRAAVVDLQFNPFVDNLLATASEDCFVKCSMIPEGGITSDINTAVVSLQGHLKKVIKLAFNPAANNILASMSADTTAKLWDIEAQAEVNSMDLGDIPFWFDWNDDGSQAIVTSKSKQFITYDPRQPGAAARADSFVGVKSARVIHCDKVGLYFGIGFGRSSARQYGIWDPRNTAKPLVHKDLDQSASVFIPHWDPDNGIIYLLGKGDSSIRYFELTKEAPYLHYLSAFSDNKSQKGGGWVPKRSVNVGKCEIAKCMRLMPDAVIPVSFQVPRKSDLFQSDLFPDAYAGMPAVESKDYLAGKTGTPPRCSMKPGASRKGGKTQFVAKKSPAELEKENAELRAKLKQLEAQLAKLQA